MSAYLVFTRNKMIDQQEFDIYSKLAGASLKGHEVKPLAFYGRHEDLEGSPTEGTVIMEFPTVAAAKTWYNSPGYSEAREHRFKAADYHVILIEGV